MDFITSAIASAVGSLGVEGIQYAYTKLKGLIQQKFGAESKMHQALQELEEQPDSKGRVITLEEEVLRAGADKDAEIVKVAQALLDAVKAQPGSKEAVRSIVDQQVTGNHSKAVAVSGSQNVSITA